MPKPITGVGYDGKRWVLLNQHTQVQIRINERLVAPRGGDCVITGGTPPHKPSSTGRVALKVGGEFYPSVVGAVWVRA